MSAIPPNRPLRLVVTGTPGTGKSTATDRLAARIETAIAATDTAVDRDGQDEGERGKARGGHEERHGEHALDADCVDVVHLNDVVQRADLYDTVDEDRESVVVDIDALATWVDDYVASTDALVVILDSHLAHHLDADRVVVLRCHPTELERRLLERGEPDAKASENAESEALDVILGETVDRHGVESVYEIETTDRTPDAVADEIAAVVTDDREPSAGTVDYIDYL